MRDTLTIRETGSRQRLSRGSRLTLIVTASALLLGCRGFHTRPVAAAHEPTQSESEADVGAVYGIALDALYARTEERPGAIVVFDSLVYGMSRECGQRVCPLSPSIDSWVQQSTLTAYGLALRSRGLFPSGVVGPAPVILISSAQLESLRNASPSLKDTTRSHDRTVDPFWDAFRERFPAAWGLTTFSRIGFNPRANQALVQVQHTCSNLCYRMESMFFQKRNGAWYLESRFPESAHDWVAKGALRYPGPDARMLKEYRKAQDSARRAIADSVALDRAPRRLRGTVRNRQTGSPIRFAQIFVHSRPGYPDPWARAVADSLGRYEIHNPPIGGTMLEVQCAGPGARFGATLDAPAVYVFPAIDTTINMTAPNIAPCWPSRRIHRLESGWFESKEAATASTPTAEERKVYAAVIDALRVGNRASPAAIYSHTIPRCAYDERCGSIQLPRLERAGLVDSAIIRDFSSKTPKPTALAPAFGRSLGLHVVTAQEIGYYAEEANPFGYRHMDARTDSALFWSVFKKLNGKGKGIISLSRVGFDSAHARALVEARLDTDMPNWTPSTMMVLQKVGGDWTVPIRDVGKDPTSGEWSGDRCLPGMAPGSPSRQAMNGLSGDFIVTMVPTIGGNRTGAVRMRFSHVQRDALGHLIPIPPAEPPLSTTPLVFEIIDQVTGKPNDRASLDFFIGGAGLDIWRKSGLYQLDGYYQSLKIRRATASGFFGDWSAGVFGPSAFGYFCARRP